MIGNLFSLVLGIGSFVKLPVVGQLPVMEILMVVGAPFVLPRHQTMFRSPFVRFFLWGGVAWLIAQVVSDWYNHIAQVDSARGLAAIGMTVLGFLVFYALFFDDAKRFLWFLVGTIPSVVYFAIAGGGSKGPEVIADNTELWDNLVAPIASPILLVVGFALIRRFPRVVAYVFIGYGVLAVIEQARSHGLIFASTGVLYLLVQRGTSVRINYGRILLWASPVLIAGFISYVHFGLKGDLGKTTQRQLATLDQPYNPAYVLLAGRMELLVALDAIADSPVFGHGSWASNPKYTRDLDWRLAQLNGYTQRPPQWAPAPEVIPSHSVIFGNWVHGGMVPGLFWITVAFVCVGVLRKAMAQGLSPRTMLALNFGLTSCWLLLFSPQGSSRGSWAAGLAYAIITIIDKRPSAQHAAETTETGSTGHSTLLKHTIGSGELA